MIKAGFVMFDYRLWHEFGIVYAFHPSTALAKQYVRSKPCQIQFANICPEPKDSRWYHYPKEQKSNWYFWIHLHSHIQTILNANEHMKAGKPLKDYMSRDLAENYLSYIVEWSAGMACSIDIDAIRLVVTSCDYLPIYLAHNKTYACDVSHHSEITERTNPLYEWEMLSPQEARWLLTTRTCPDCGGETNAVSSTVVMCLECFSSFTNLERRGRLSGPERRELLRKWDMLHMTQKK